MEQEEFESVSVWLQRHSMYVLWAAAGEWLCLPSSSDVYFFYSWVELLIQQCNTYSLHLKSKNTNFQSW